MYYLLLKLMFSKQVSNPLGGIFSISFVSKLEPKQKFMTRQSDFLDPSIFLLIESLFY